MNNKVFPIGDLPVEVLEHIFSFLPLSDRKSTSLVCHQWEKLTFSRRFLGNVKLELRLWCKSQQTFLLRSSRRYRHLSGFMDVYVGKESCFKYMLEIVDLFGQDVESLQCQGHFTTDQLFLVLSRLPNLQQLIVGLHRWNQSIKLPTLAQLQAMGLLNNVLEIESLDVPMVTQLSIVIGSAAEGKDSMPVLKRLAPHLKNVDLNSNQCFIPVEQLQFPKAEALRIGRTLFVAQIDLHLKTVFAGFKLLKEVVLDCHVEEITLDAITKACPGIELFKFNGGLLPIPLHLLERLKYLKTLDLGSVYEDEDSEINLECNPLESVKTLNLHLSVCGKNFIERLRYLLPNVIAMDVTLIDDWELECGIKLICQNFRGLQRLQFSNKIIQDQKLNSIYLPLDDLEELEELTLTNFKRHIMYMPANPRLRRFVINHPYRLYNEDLLNLARLYPNLRYLELGWGRQVTDEGIAAFKSQLVNCLVHTRMYTFTE